MKPTFTLHSPETGTEYVIFVAPPPNQTPGPWPVVFFMDGDDQFSIAVAAYRKLHKAQAVRPLLLVGVGYGAGYAKPANKRGRDYTPTPHGDEAASGGADVFARFLRATLLPELTRRYPLSADTRGIAGHSLGSLFALHELWQEPQFFTHYLASAPSIWWDDRSILRLGADRYARNATLMAHLFLSVGENDSASSTGDVALLEQQLKENRFSGLTLTVRRFPGRDHYNVLPEAFEAGFAALFGNSNLPPTDSSVS